ncbi:hypothetical protein [Gemella haemolysans]|uniref:hypothetical protein n=1 Tax=Gemella haemolysans TaxID=1379 RepID=UPI00058C7188|nr:hypothetical protein [Gemella haemolysans]
MLHFLLYDITEKITKKYGSCTKIVELKRIILENGVEIIGGNKIIVISCYNNGKLPVFIEVNKVVRRKRYLFNKCYKVVEEYSIWSTDLDIDKNKKIKIMPAEFIEIYKVDLKWVAEFYHENKSKLKSCEDLCFCVEELEGEIKYIKINDIFEK